MNKPEEEEEEEEEADSLHHQPVGSDSVTMVTPGMYVRGLDFRIPASFISFH